jgi:hypothetical protein
MGKRKVGALEKVEADLYFSPLSRRRYQILTSLGPTSSTKFVQIHGMYL